MNRAVPYILITILSVLLALAVVSTSDGAIRLPPALGG